MKLPGASEWRWQRGPNRRAALPSDGVPLHLRESLYAAHDGTGSIDEDPYLEPERQHLAGRFALFQETLGAIEALDGGLDRFTRGWEYFGFTRGAAVGAGAGAGVLSVSVRTCLSPCAAW
jgi:hypothetical protein